MRKLCLVVNLNLVRPATNFSEYQPNSEESLEKGCYCGTRGT